MDEGALAGIGATPVVRLHRLTEDGAAEVWVKLEAANPTGSYKDRMALAMIGRRAGRRLGPGPARRRVHRRQHGKSLAFVCAVTGYPLHIVSSDAFAEEKRRDDGAFGADGRAGAEPGRDHADADPADARRAAEMAAELGAFQTDQFHNTDMIEGYRASGEELVAQVPATDRRAVPLRRDRRLLPRVEPGAARGPSRRCAGSRWSRPSRPCSRAGRRGPTASRAAASASGPTCCVRRTWTR